MTSPAHRPEVGRPPAFVSRETGARELDISPDTWDAMVSRGLLPEPVRVGINSTTKRWRWMDVEQAVCGTATSGGPIDPFMEGLKNGKAKGRSRAAA